MKIYDYKNHYTIVEHKTYSRLNISIQTGDLVGISFDFDINYYDNIDNVIKQDFSHNFIGNIQGIFLSANIINGIEKNKWWLKILNDNNNIIYIFHNEYYCSEWFTTKLS